MLRYLFLVILGLLEMQSLWGQIIQIVALPFLGGEFCQVYTGGPAVGEGGSFSTKRVRTLTLPLTTALVAVCSSSLIVRGWTVSRAGVSLMAGVFMEILLTSLKLSLASANCGELCRVLCHKQMF